MSATTIPVKTWEISDANRNPEIAEDMHTDMERTGWPRGEQEDGRPDPYFGIQMALEEAVVNAVKHGNQEDPTKKVTVTTCVTADLISIEVQDQGNGFNPMEVPDPTADENLERPCGRGLMFMRRFMTAVEYNSIGNFVAMTLLRSLRYKLE
jgi:serine/threonine-protein kinase RsbW